MRIACFWVAIALASLSATAGADDLFAIRILSHPSAVPLGIAAQAYSAGGPLDGWVKTHMAVEITYRGHDPLPIVPNAFPGYRDGRGVFSVFAEAVDDTGTKLTPCPPEAFANVAIVGTPEIPPGWSKWLELPVCMPGVGTYEVRVVAEQTKSSFTNLQGKELTLWTGHEVSGPVHIEVTEPEGVDREVYQAFNRDPLRDSEKQGEILRRFPTSTYAAYIVWKRSSRTVARTSTATALQHMTGEFYRGSSVPCDDEKKCDDNGWMWLKADELVAWRDRWFASVLKGHPDIWFADDLRFNLALDHYLLGDKAGCEAALEELAASRRPYVAEKVEQLLEAMREKGMLETERCQAL